MSNRERQLTHDFLMGTSLAPGHPVTGKNGKARKQKLPRDTDREGAGARFQRVACHFPFEQPGRPSVPDCKSPQILFECGQKNNGE